jgi:hypothetical protein
VLTEHDLLNVELSKDGQYRAWVITQVPPGRWAYRVTSPGVAKTGALTESEVQATLLRFRAEIASAKSAGWS